MVVYWSVLHEPTMEKLSKEGVINSEGKIMYAHLVHFIPAAACFFNTISTQCIMKRGLVKGIVVINLIFSFSQFCNVKMTGQVLYFFLNFNDGVVTYLVIVGLTVGAAGIYLMLCSIDEWLKAPNENDIEEMDEHKKSN